MSKKKKKLRNPKKTKKLSALVKKMARQQEFVDRDLSVLEFNKRVLEQAKDSQVPLLERARFLSIFHSNLDEFFMKRMWLSRYLYLNKDGVHTQDKMNNIRPVVQGLLDEAADCFKLLKSEFVNEGIELITWKDLKPKEKTKLIEIFDNNIFPVLTPLSVDMGHPFPHISTLSTSLAIALKYPNKSDLVFSRLKIPDFFPSYYCCSEENDFTKSRWINVKEIVMNNLDRLFPKMEVVSVLPFRITRNIELEQQEVAEEGDSILSMIEKELKDRKFGEIVKLEYKPPKDDWLLGFLKSELDVFDCDIYEMKSTLDFSSLLTIYDLNMKRLKFDRWQPTTKADLVNKDIFDSISRKDIMLHHPYESFATSVERFILDAVEDPSVIAIKMTLYRTNSDGSITKALMRAAEMGKEVVCLVELQARLDEEKNISWAQQLEDAGCHVVYGVVGLKTHCKVALVVRNEQQQIKTYAHIGTGNYNSQTANFYTDLGLLTANKKITDEVVELFHYLTGRSLKNDYKKLVVAPMNLKSFFLKKIKSETRLAQSGEKTRIIVKCNNLEDVDVCEALYEASQAGVQVDLIVRTICTLRPQLKDFSKNINVYSIVDRFLEHSRVFYFQQGKHSVEEAQVYIGSADLMHRNLTNRVEVLAPIEGKEHRREVYEILTNYLTPDYQTWKMQSDGSYIRLKGDMASSQEKLFIYYQQRNIR